VIRAAAASLLVALLAAGAASPAPRTRCPNGTGFAQLAYVKGGALIVLDMPACGGRVLVARGAHGRVRWSGDGRYVSFGTDVVSADGRRVFRGLRGVWAPRGHVLATLTKAGGVVVGGPGLDRRQVVPEGFGAHSLAFDPAGTQLAVARAHLRATAPPSDRELWIVDTRTGARRLVYQPAARNPNTPVVVGWAPGGFVLFRLAMLPANSVNLDGLPLLAVHARGGPARGVLDATLSYDEFYARCGRRVAISAGRDRVATRGKRIVLTGPPAWRARDVSSDRARSWITPACSPDGRWIAVSAGRNWHQTRFGLERRSIWILSVDGRTRRRLTAPPPGRSDELPRWAADGRAVFFVRSGPTTREAIARGRLYVVRTSGQAADPLSDLGVTGNYYGRYGWAEQTDLFVPRANQSSSR
jgi:dipeptidyl aminopeptidase/acylaminoacyl peptidase